MKKNMLLILFMVFYLGCETGTRYDRNTTIQILPKHEAKSGLVDRDDIEALLDDDKEVEGEPYYDEGTSDTVEETEVESKVNSFSSKLDVRKIREGKHEGYIRLVFDVYDDVKKSKTVGKYQAKYNSSKKDISVILYNYKNFSASLPSFPYYSIIEQIHFEQYPKDKGFKFHIKLRKNAKVKIFDLKSPARIVFDIKPI